MLDPRTDTQPTLRPDDTPITQAAAQPPDDAGTAAALGDDAAALDAPTAETAQPVITVAGTLGDDTVALLDLPRWTEHLRALPTWHDGDRASSMLLRQPPVRVLLTALRSGAELGSDGAQETVMMLVLSGAMRMQWRGEVARVGEHEVAFVPAGGGWRVTSDAPETVLLSTFWGTPGTGLADDADDGAAGIDPTDGG